MDSLKRITISACALFIMLGFVAGGVSKLWDYQDEKKNSDIAETASVNENSPPSHPEKYVLKIEDGVVVVYNEADMLRPIIVTDIYASTLRRLDREDLTDGVVASNEVELQTMLEDYSS